MAKEKVSITLHPDLLAEVDYLAGELGLTRTEMVSWALCHAMKSPAATQEEHDWMRAIDQQFSDGHLEHLLKLRAEELHQEEMARRFGGPDE